MPITFKEAATTWGLAMESKNLTELEMMMCDDYEKKKMLSMH